MHVGLKFLVSEDNGATWREHTFDRLRTAREDIIWDVSTTYLSGSTRRLVSKSRLAFREESLRAFKRGRAIAAQKISSCTRFVQIKLHS